MAITSEEADTELIVEKARVINADVSEIEHLNISMVSNQNKFKQIYLRGMEDYLK